MNASWWNDGDFEDKRIDGNEILDFVPGEEANRISSSKTTISLDWKRTSFWKHTHYIAIVKIECLSDQNMIGNYVKCQFSFTGAVCQEITNSERNHRVISSVTRLSRFMYRFSRYTFIFSDGWNYPLDIEHARCINLSKNLHIHLDISKLNADPALCSLRPVFHQLFNHRLRLYRNCPMK